MPRPRYGPRRIRSAALMTAPASGRLRRSGRRRHRSGCDDERQRRGAGAARALRGAATAGRITKAGPPMLQFARPKGGAPRAEQLAMPGSARVASRAGRRIAVVALARPAEAHPVCDVAQRADKGAGRGQARRAGLAPPSDGGQRDCGLGAAEPEGQRWRPRSTLLIMRRRLDSPHESAYRRLTGARRFMRTAGADDNRSALGWVKGHRRITAPGEQERRTYLTPNSRHSRRA